MARSYQRKVPKMPRVDVPDWTLLEGIAGLFEEYKGDNGSLRLSATDSRGEYHEESFPAFRAEVERQHEAPTDVTISLDRYDAYLHFQIWTSREELGSGSVFRSTTEADVVYVAERCGDLLRQAHARREAREEAERRQVAPPASAEVAHRVSAAPPERKGTRGFFYNPWVVTIGGSLTVAAIIALVVALTH